MPLINFGYGDLCGLLGEEVPRETLMERIPMIGADMHSGDTGGDAMSVEFFPDRPDLFCVEGMARALRPFLGLGGAPSYEVFESEVSFIVEDSVRGVRPYAACAIVRGVDVDDRVLKSMMDMQEKMHVTVGRKRAKLAIGIHALSAVRPPFTYKAVKPNEIRFVPLASEEEMDLDGVLEKHPKGREFAHLLEGKDRYPVIVDADGVVLSFPPIINGEATTVRVGKRDLLIDVTGTEPRAVKTALDLVSTALAERGGTIYSVETFEGGRSFIAPDLTPTSWCITSGECSAHLGIKLKPKEIVEALRRMGYAAHSDGGRVNVDVPAIRVDIMHKVDLYEDVAIGHGYERFGGRHGQTQTTGSLMPSTRFSEGIRDLLVGLGYTEVVTLTLSSERDEFELPRIPAKGTVKLLNPISEDHTCLRASLFPSLMRVFRKNKHRDLPQRIFEIGDVVDGSRRKGRVCVAEVDSRSSFTGIKSVAETLLRETCTEYALEPSALGTFIDGRGAEVVSGGETVGWFGEVSPAVLEDFEISHPMAFVELDLAPMARKRG